MPFGAASSADVETVERFIPAPPEAIFAVIADPARHREIDGSGTVRGTTDAPQQLRLGSRFGMRMNAGVPYSMVNTVTEYDENRVLAWQTTTPLPVLGALVGGRVWRYELQPVQGGTRVTESWDISQERMKPLIGLMRSRTRQAMIKTLERLEQIVAR